MTRPRKDSTEPSARERLLGAFWELLSEMPYESITVAALVKRAKVSPNTLYSHFDGYRGVVRAALHEVLDPRLLPMLVSGIEVEDAARESEATERLDKVILFASDGSGELSCMLKEVLLETWLRSLGLSKGELTPLEEAELDFIFAGVASMLSNKSAVKHAGDRELMRGFFQRPLGSGVLATIDSLRPTRRNDTPSRSTCAPTSTTSYPPTPRMA